MSNSIQTLHQLGQSLWYDNIQRRLLRNGELEHMIRQGDIRGVTSNPTIFQKAITASEDYDHEIRSLAEQGLETVAIFETLAVDDIRAATDLFLPLYEETDGRDGYVSIEVNPHLAYDTEGTISEARRLWETVNRPNLMVKIPATEPGLPAISASIAAGLNINVTLIFSLKRYAEVMAAYIEGLTRRLTESQTVARVASVASFFVSRVDTKVDRRLEAVIRKEGPLADLAAALMGKAAVANARLAYLQFLEVFEADSFRSLKDAGARVQRPLWASTSTKNPRYSDVKYVEELIAPETVNTVPQETLDAFRDHGIARVTIRENLDAVQTATKSLADLGISMDDVTRELEEEGVQAFADSYDSLIETIEAHRKDVLRS